MATMKVQTATTLQQSTRIEEPGTYHMLIAEISTELLDRNNVPIPNCFEVMFEVLDGTHRVNGQCSQKGRTLHVRFYVAEDPTDSDGAKKWKVQKRTALLIATGLMTKDSLGKEVNFDTDDLLDKQVIMNTDFGKPDDSGKKYVELAWANIYHPTDDKVAAVPKNLDALKKGGYPVPAQQTTANASNSTTATKNTAASKSTDGNSNGQSAKPAPKANAEDWNDV